MTKFESVNSGPPKGITVEEQSDQRAKASFRASTGFGYQSGTIIGGLVGGIIAVIGFLLMAFGSFVIGLLMAAGGIGLAFLILEMLKTKVSIEVTPEAVTMNSKHYDRSLWDGFRHGEEITYTHQTKNSSSQKSFGKLSFSYGGRSHETSWMVPREKSVNYVNWLNELIDSVGAPPPPEHAPETGTRKQKF